MESLTAITLLTDFGLADTYVGVMKGVMLSRCPQARFVDLTHGIDAGDVGAAADHLETSWRYFPEGTVHLVVVDPGVGSARRAIAAEADGHRFIAPDNGVLGPTLQSASTASVVRIDRSDILLQPVSRTFHGRDIFAPAAAAAAAEASIHGLGPPIDDWIRLTMPAVRRDPDGSLEGEVIRVDRFGNLITNLREEDLPDRPRIQIKERAIHGTVDSYAAVAAGEFLSIIGSSGRLEVSINRGNARAALAAEVGERVWAIPQ